MCFNILKVFLNFSSKQWLILSKFSTVEMNVNFNLNHKTLISKYRYVIKYPKIKVYYVNLGAIT